MHSAQVPIVEVDYSDAFSVAEGILRYNIRVCTKKKERKSRIFFSFANTLYILDAVRAIPISAEPAVEDPDSKLRKHNVFRASIQQCVEV